MDIIPKSKPPAITLPPGAMQGVGAALLVYALMQGSAFVEEIKQNSAEIRALSATLLELKGAIEEARPP